MCIYIAAHILFHIATYSKGKYKQNESFKAGNKHSLLHVITKSSEI